MASIGIDIQDLILQVLVLVLVLVLILNFGNCQVLVLTLGSSKVLVLVSETWYCPCLVCTNDFFGEACIRKKLRKTQPIIAWYL